MLAVAGGVAGAWPAMAREHAAEPVARMCEALKGQEQGAGRRGERKLLFLFTGPKAFYHPRVELDRVERA